MKSWEHLYIKIKITLNTSMVNEIKQQTEHETNIL